MSKNVTTIILCAVCLILGLLLMKSCDNQDKIVQQYQDSIKKREIVIDSVKRRGDSIKASADVIFSESLAEAFLSREREDSLTHIIGVLQGKYNTVKDSTVTLWKQLKVFYLSGDTANLRAAYYGLKDELDSTNALMMQIQFQDQAREYGLRNDLDSSQARVVILKQQLDALKSLLDRQTQIAEASNREEAKILAAQKRKKIWGLIKDIGIGLAGIFVGKKL